MAVATKDASSGSEGNAATKQSKETELSFPSV